MPADPERAPIIVYGAARSGTTYVVQILNSRPDVFVSNETRRFVWAHRSLTGVTEDQAALLEERQPFLEHLYRAYPGLIRDFYRKLCPAATHWGDKNPHYASPENRGCLDTILALFPAARFIHVLRDGRDVVSSGLRGVWWDFDAVHQMWTTHTDTGSAFGRSLPQGQYYELRYETLVHDDTAAAANLFRFLGLDLHPATAEFCKAQQVKRTPYCVPSRDLSRGAGSSDWATLLTAPQRLRSLEFLGEGLVRHGYETEASLAALREAVRRET
jgi:hypothetical protein